MTPLALAGLIFSAMLLLMVLRIPIAVSMFAAGGIGYVLQAGWAPLSSFLTTQAFARFASYDLSVIPLFILMGHFATQGGISRALFAFASALMARFRGGLAMASVLASAGFGAICGSSVATAATITSVALPELRRAGYSDRLSTGALSAGGTLGILIPPSVPLVIYAILTEQNLAKLFAAAVIPGLIAMLGYMLVIAVYVRKVPGHAPAAGGNDHPLTWSLVVSVLPIVGVFTVVFGGIYGGLFTPTEGASVGAIATFLAAWGKGELTRTKLAECFYATAESTGMIFLIFMGADVMNAALALTQLPTQLPGLIQGWGLSPWVLMALIIVFYNLLGSVMDELSMLLLTIPIFFPIVMGLDFGLSSEGTALWFGILVLMTVGFGMLCPPVALNVYVVNSMAKSVPIADSYRGVMPFLASDVIRIALLLFFPGLCLWLVGFVG